MRADNRNHQRTVGIPRIPKKEEEEEENLYLPVPPFLLLRPEETGERKMKKKTGKKKKKLPLEAGARNPRHVRLHLLSHWLKKN